MMCIIRTFVKIIEFFIDIDWSIIKDLAIIFISLATFITTFYFAHKSYLLEKENIKLQNFNPEIKIIKTSNGDVYIAIVNTWLVTWYVEYAGFFIWKCEVEYLWQKNILSFIGQEISSNNNITNQISIKRLKESVNKNLKCNGNLIEFHIMDSSYRKRKYIFRKNEWPELYE